MRNAVAKRETAGPYPVPNGIRRRFPVRPIIYQRLVKPMPEGPSEHLTMRQASEGPPIPTLPARGSGYHGRQLQLLQTGLPKMARRVLTVEHCDSAIGVETGSILFRRGPARRISGCGSPLFEKERHVCLEALSRPRPTQWRKSRVAVGKLSFPIHRPGTPMP